MGKTVFLLTCISKTPQIFCCLLFAVGKYASVSRSWPVRSSLFSFSVNVFSGIGIFFCTFLVSLKIFVASLRIAYIMPML